MPLILRRVMQEDFEFQASLGYRSIQRDCFQRGSGWVSTSFCCGRMEVFRSMIIACRQSIVPTPQQCMCFTFSIIHVIHVNIYTAYLTLNMVIPEVTLFARHPSVFYINSSDNKQNRHYHIQSFCLNIPTMSKYNYIKGGEQCNLQLHSERKPSPMKQKSVVFLLPQIPFTADVCTSERNLKL